MKSDIPRDSAGSLGWYFWTSVAIIFIFCAVNLREAALQSVTSDEPPHIAAGLSYFVTHEIFRANPQHPPLLKELSALSLKAAGIRWPNSPEANDLVHSNDPARVFGLDWGTGNDIIRKNGPDRTLFWARLPMVLVAGLLGLLLFIWGRQLLGSMAALGAVVVFACDPTILGHAHFVTTDVGVACFSVLALYALWSYLRFPSWLHLVLCGLALGAALATKFSGVILLPVFGLLLLAAQRWPLASAAESEASLEKKPEHSSAAIHRKDLCPCGSGKKYKNCHGRLPQESAHSFRKLALAGGTFALIFLVAFVFVQMTYFFPGDWTMYVKCARMVGADHDPNYLAYLAGELRPRFTDYFAAAFCLKQPLAELILTLIGLAALIRSKRVPLLGKVFLLCPPGAFFLATTLLADDLGIRYLIPCLPFVHLIAGFGIASLFEARHRFAWTPYATAALCLWGVAAAAGAYPDHLSYFNETACLLEQPGKIGLDGGSRCGPAWLDDSNVDWGQGWKQLRAWLDRHAAGRQVNFALMGTFPPEGYGLQGPHLGMTDLMHRPAPGLYAVSAHLVARVPAFGPGGSWLRTTPPAAVVGHAIYIYDIPAK